MQLSYSRRPAGTSPAACNLRRQHRAPLPRRAAAAFPAGRPQLPGAARRRPPLRVTAGLPYVPFDEKMFFTMMAVVALQPLVTFLGKRVCTSLVCTFPTLRFLEEAAVEVEQLQKEVEQLQKE